MSSLELELPMIALRGMTVLPGMVIHFDVNRKKSVKSIDYAMKTNQQVFLVSQKSPDIIEPTEDDVFRFGAVCEVKQLVKMPGGVVRVLVKGLFRAEKIGWREEEDRIMSVVKECPNEEWSMSDVDRESRIGLLKELMKRLYEDTERNKGDNVMRIRGINSLDELIYRCAADCTEDVERRQSILEEEDIIVRYDMVCDFIYEEIEICRIKKQLTEDIKARVDRNQKEYMMREQMALLREELGDNGDEEIEEFKEKVDKLDASDEVKAKLHKEIKRYESIPNHASESYVLRSYIETLLELPWNFKSEDNNDIVHAEQILDEDHYGLKKVKERVVEYLAVRALTGGGEQPILCLVGPPGTGKTSIATSIAKALNRQYVRICLGGVRDEAEIRGHRKTYVGAMPGRIVEALRQAKTCNPLMLLDEVDKVGQDQRGDTASALLEILDSAQNVAFRDHYVEVPINLSEVLFIATANDASLIPKPLLDRMDVIEISTYTPIEKFHIAKEHLIPKQMQKHGLTAKDVAINDEAIRRVIENYTKESGVRELERQIGKILRKSAKQILDGSRLKHKITKTNLSDYLGPVRYTADDARKTDAVGVVRGLAWTSVGGTTLDVEACLMEGKGGLQLTGRLGDVMKESAQVSLGYIRAHAKEYHIDPKVFEEQEIHIHIPEGAVPKDGPSAGITMTLAMLSVLTNRPVAHEFAMTGEVTLHGEVLPIGGLKEKLLAAKMAGATDALVPFKNRKDILEINEEDTAILEGITIHYVKTMKDVVKEALRTK